MKHRVWIEIEYPKTDTEGHQRAAFLNDLLAFSTGFTGPPNVWWDMASQAYHITCDDAGGSVELHDHGRWFDLELISGNRRD